MNINNITDIASLSASYKGEIFAARNAVIEEIKKFIPFDGTTTQA